MQHDLDVVNHQIQHNANVDAAVWEGGKTMRFDEPWVVHAFFKLQQHRIEALDVADLENDTLGLREFDERLRFRVGFADGFFHHHMNACLHQRFGHFAVEDRRHSHCGGIHPLGKVGQITGGMRAKLCGKFCRTRSVGIIHGGEIDGTIALRGDLRHDAGVILANSANSSDSDAERGTHDQK